MVAEPTLNDFLDLIRQPLNEVVETLRRTVKKIEAEESARGNAENLVERLLDEGKKVFESGAINTFAELRRIAATTRLDPKELRQLTYQELTNRLAEVKAVIDPEGLKKSAGSRDAHFIDRRIKSLDTGLLLMIRQMDTGLLDLDKSSRGSFNPGSFDPGSFDTSAIDAVRINAEHRRRNVAAVIATSAAVDPPVASTAPVPISSVIVRAEEPRDGPQPTLRSGEHFPSGSSVQAITAQSSIGKAVLDNELSIEIAGVILVASLDARIADLKERRDNSDEAHELITQYEDLKQRVEDFLIAAAEFAKGALEENKVVASKSSFADGLKDIWARRHLQLADVAMLGTAVMICHLADPLSVVIAGVVVSGNKVATALKAAAELAKKT